MTTPSVLVLRAAGTNCERETAFAFEHFGARSQTLHVNALLAEPGQLLEHHILAIPGGFSYGDDVGAGAVFACELGTRLADPLRSFISDGGLVLGICNGFQVLVRLGLLPGLQDTLGTQEVSLTDNVSHKYEDRWAHCAIESRRCVFIDAMGLRNGTRTADHRGDAELVAIQLGLGVERHHAGRLPRPVAQPAHQPGLSGLIKSRTQLLPVDRAGDARNGSAGQLQTRPDALLQLSYVGARKWTILDHHLGRVRNDVARRSRLDLAGVERRTGRLMLAIGVGVPQHRVAQLVQIAQQAGQGDRRIRAGPRIRTVRGLSRQVDDRPAIALVLRDGHQARGLSHDATRVGQIAE